MTNLTDTLTAIASRHVASLNFTGTCHHCLEDWPCVDHSGAEAMLAVVAQIRSEAQAIDQLLGFALNAADVAAPLTLEEAVKQARTRIVAILALTGDTETRTP